jgi:hypothetical protein
MTIAAILVAGGVAAWRAWHFEFVADDTFIGLRYLRHLLEGNGLVYNIGERVEGYSNFAWLIALLPLGAVGIDLVAASRWLGFACGLAAVALAIRVAGGLVPAATASWARWTAGLLVAVSVPFACWSASGMETPLFALLSIGIAAAAMSERFAAPAAGALAGVAALTRPEGVVLGPIAIAFAAIQADSGRRLRRAMAAAIPWVMIVASHLAFRRLYYGDWVPNTYHAKVGDFSLALLVRGLDYLTLFARENGGILLFLVPLAAVAWRRDAAWYRVLALLLTLVVCVVLVGGDGLPMYRFAAHLVPLWAVLAGVFIADLARLRGRATRIAAAALAGLAVLLTAMGPPEDSMQRMLYTTQKNYEVPAWTAVGKWLRVNSDPGDSVACVPIGAIGWYSELPLVDMLGLTDAHIARVEIPTGIGFAGHEKHDGRYVLSREPTFLLLGNVRVMNERLPLQHPEFVRINHPGVEGREGDIYGPELQRHYKPVVTHLGNGFHLHYLRRR